MTKTMFTAQIAPTISKARGKDREAEYITFNIDAVNYGTAVSMAGKRAQEKTAEAGQEYGVVRVW